MRQAQSVVVLAYHALDSRPSAVSTAPSVFAWQMAWLHDNGYHVLRLGELVPLLHSGAALPPRAAVITFDDGFESVYTEGLPSLIHFGFPATVFVILDYCGANNDWPSQPPSVPRSRLLSWSQIQEMDRQGFEFGAHTCTHPRLDQLQPWEIEREVLGSKQSLEDRLGHEVELFAYPYGRYTEPVKAIVRTAFSGACAGLGLVTRQSDPFALPRVDAYYVQQPWLFGALSSTAFPLYIGLRRELRLAASTVLRRAWA